MAVAFTYVSDSGDVLTYHLGSKAFVLSLEDVTNDEYFEMAEVATVKPSPLPPPTEPILGRLYAQHRGMREAQDADLPLGSGRD
jgi:hypothetical protein